MNIVSILIVVFTAMLGIKGLKGNLPLTRNKNITGIPAIIIGILCLALSLLLIVGAIMSYNDKG